MTMNTKLLIPLLLSACSGKVSALIPDAPADASYVPQESGVDTSSPIDSGGLDVMLNDAPTDAKDAGADVGDSATDAPTDTLVDVSTDTPQEAYVLVCAPITGTYTRTATLESSDCNVADASDESLVDAAFEAGATVSTVSFANDYPSLFAGCAVLYNKSSNACYDSATITCTISSSQVSIEHDSISVKDPNANNVQVTSVVAIQDSVTYSTICTSVYQTSYTR